MHKGALKTETATLPKNGRLPHKLPTTETFEFKNWHFICRKGPIWGATELENATGQLLPKSSAVDRVPDAFFGHNFLEVHFVPEHHSDTLVPTCCLESPLRVPEIVSNSDTQNKKTCNVDNSESNLLGIENAETPILTAHCDSAPVFTSENIDKGYNWVLNISPLEAVNGINWNEVHCFPESTQFIPTSLTVPQAAKWKKRIEDEEAYLVASGEIETIEPCYDWTCSSKYWGTIRLIPQDTSVLQHEPNHCIHYPRYQTYSTTSCAINQITDTDSNKSEDVCEIPMNLLTDTSLPILWLQQCDLFSDDLSDSGINTTDVKIRVMPSFWFILYRQAVRVDSVALRQVDVRLFHLFGSNYIIRECIWKEALYSILQQRKLKLINGSREMMSRHLATSKQMKIDIVPGFEHLNDTDIIFKAIQHIVLPIKY